MNDAFNAMSPDNVKAFKCASHVEVYDGDAISVALDKLGLPGRAKSG
jgi:hypothetical protein